MAASLNKGSVVRPALVYALGARMQAKVDELCIERDRQLSEQRRKYIGTNKVNGPIERRFR